MFKDRGIIVTKANRDWVEDLRLDTNPHIFLTNAEKVLNYALQPIVDAHSGDVYGYEALVRNTDQLGCATPLELFDLAHSIGCLARLELVLRRKAVASFASIANREKARLFLNVDARLFESNDFMLQETNTILSHHDLKPSDICLEVSEAGDTSKMSKVQEFVDLARSMDFAFALDDFGRAYSHLKSLYDFQPDILKLDRFFIMTIQNDARKRLMVGAMVDLAHVLGMRVVAEGVETEAELKICRQLGCDLIQGYLVARPSIQIADLQPRYDQVAATAAIQRQPPQSDSELVRREIRPLVALRDDATMDDVLSILRAGRAYPVIPVINAADEPRGLIQESDIKDLIYMPFGQDLLRNKTVNNQLRKFVHRCPIADLNSKLDQLIGMIAHNDDTGGGVIITSNGKYYGFLTTSSLLKIANEIRMREAEDQNPLTKLPGNVSVTSYVSEEATNTEVERSFSYIDFDNFKPFNDTYGFRMGDRALLLFSEFVKRFPKKDRDFAGHVGGDDFFIGLRDRSLKDVEEHMSVLQAEFRHQAESLYDAQHREDGFICAKDRTGVERRFPLLSCSVAILHLPAGLAVENQDLLLRQIAALKYEAKTVEGGIATATFGNKTHPQPTARVLTMQGALALK